MKTLPEQINTLSGIRLAIERLKVRLGEVRSPGTPSRRRRPWRTVETLEARELLTLDLEWANRIGGVSNENAGSIAVDSAGNLYTTGYFSGTVDFDPGSGVVNLVSAGSEDVYITKSDASGQLLWARAIGGTSSDVSTGIAVDSGGNILLAGYFWGTADFDPGANPFNMTSAGGYDGFVVKLTSSGAFVWSKRVGGTSSDYGRGVAVGSGNDVYLAGDFNGTCDFDPGAGITSGTAQGQDVFVLKLSSLGEYVGVDVIGGTGIEVSTGIAGNRQGRIAVSGRFSSATMHGLTNAGSAGTDDVFVASYTPEFSRVWMKSVAGSGDDSNSDVVIDSAGNVTVAGTLTDQSGGSPYSDPFVTRFSAVGTLLWSRRFRNSSTNGAFGSVLALGLDGEIYFTGSFSQDIDLDPGSSDFLATASTSGSDNFLVSLSTTGLFRSGRVITNTGFFFANKMLIDGSGNQYIAGNFTASADLDPGIGVTNLASTGGFDAFVAKFSPDFLYQVPTAFSGYLDLRRNGTNLDLVRRVSQLDPAAAEVLDSHPIDRIRSVRITGRDAASDSLILNFGAGGGYTIPGGVVFDGKSGSDSLLAVGTRTEAITWAPSTTLGSGQLSVWNQSVNFAGVENSAFAEFAHLIVDPQGGADQLTATTTSGIFSGSATFITGTTGGVSIPALDFLRIPQLTINTGSVGNGIFANDSITINANALDADGLQNVYIRTGRGNDTLTINGPDIGLPVTGGAFWYLGGSGVDTLVASGDAHWSLNDVRLVSSGGGRILHDDLEKAEISGGASINNISADGFSGDAVLYGADGNDVLRGGFGNDVLYGSSGNDRLYGGAGSDILWGSDGNDLLYGESGDDTLRGGNHNDRLFGGDDNDWLHGEAGSDILDGGADDDTLIGGTGTDLYDLKGTQNAESLALERVSATSARFRRKPPGLSTTLELDSLTLDAVDEILISALGGDDTVVVDSLFTQLGAVDGGDGTDTCTAPAAWTKVSC